MNDTPPLPPAPSPDACPSLDTPETSLRIALSQDQTFTSDPATWETNFRHSGWSRDRIRVIEALHEADVPLSRQQNFRDCGHHAWVFEHRDDHRRLRVVSDHCHDRFCLPCGQERARRICGKLAPKIAASPHRLITLTLVEQQEPLAATLERLQTGWTRLTRTKEWQVAVKGGAAMLEIKYRGINRGWNVHLHAIVEGKFLAQKVLSRLWRKVTGGSYVVDIRLIRDPKAALKYVTKYVTKPLDASVLRCRPALVEAVHALNGTRLVRTWGSFVGLKLCATDPESLDGWQRLCSLRDLVDRSWKAERAAIQRLAILHGWCRVDDDTQIDLWPYLEPEHPPDQAATTPTPDPQLTLGIAAAERYHWYDR